MKVKRNLVQLVQSDYTPLQTSAEGLLRGGFGSIAVGKAIIGDINANICRNPKCTNGECTNPECSNQCTINYCGPTTPTTPTIGPSVSPTPTVTTMCIGF
jgi:hypothetical protein